jgi:predicted Ser/Thr protein kinase
VRSPAPVQEIRSASTELLASESLQELKRLIQTAYEEHEDITRELAGARREKASALTRYLSWDHGWLFKRTFKNSFAKRKVDAETASAKVEELEEQLRQTTISTHVEIAKEQAEPYFQMRDKFAALSECAAIWDTKSRQATDRFRERTIAHERIARDRTQLSLGGSDLIQWEQKVPHLQNVSGGDLFLYPGFILY